MGGAAAVNCGLAACSCIHLLGAGNSSAGNLTAGNFSPTRAGIA
jgi:hypothetical protein